jgi:hypothetical protein
MSDPGHVQTPALHVPPVAHRWPHAPQLFRSVMRFGQPPPGHIITPAAHVHTPDEQLPPTPQLRAHIPQFIVSVATFTHVGGVPHTTWPAGHGAHEPAMHTIPVGHA